jgi:hypothetical protein
LALCENQADRFRQEAPCNERERQGGRPVQPLGVVDHADERLFLSDLCKQAEDGQTDDEAVGRRS